MNKPLIKCFIEVSDVKFYGVFDKYCDKRNIKQINPHSNYKSDIDRIKFAQKYDKKYKEDSDDVWLIKWHIDELLPNKFCHNNRKSLDKEKNSDQWEEFRQNPEWYESITTPHMNRKNCCWRNVLRTIINGTNTKHHPSEIWFYHCDRKLMEECLESLGCSNINYIETSIIGTHNVDQIWSPDKPQHYFNSNETFMLSDESKHI